MDTHAMQVLDGVRVVEWREAMAGPYAAILLGDLGADVIKVERRGTGDQWRSGGPPFARTESTYSCLLTATTFAHAGHKFSARPGNFAPADWARRRLSAQPAGARIADETRPLSYRLPPPLLGEHTDGILAEVGLSAEEISEARGCGVV